MNCYKCSGVGKNKSDNKFFCNKCFLEIIEKRARKEIRMHDLISKNDRILVINDSSIGANLNKYFLKQIIKDPTITIKLKKITKYDRNADYDKKNEYTKIALPTLLDNEIENYLESFFKNKKGRFLHNGKNIKPVIGITIDEAKTFLKIKKIAFKEPENKGEIKKMLKRFEKKYPGTKFSILKTIRNIEGEKWEK